MGAFLSLLRFTQQRTTVEWFAQFSDDTRNRLIANRNRSPYQPPIPLGMDGQLSYDPIREDPEDLNLFRQTWHDLQLVHALMYDSEVQDATAWNIPEAFALAVADMVLYASETCALGDYPGNAVARQWYSMGNESIPLVAIGGKRLTTRLLFEGMATTNELIASLAAVRTFSTLTGGDYSNLSFAWENANKALSGDYGIAFNHFMRLASMREDEYIFCIPTFNAVCFAALNPPLPPLATGPIEGNSQRHWPTIYPPLRFIRLCKAVPAAGKLSMDAGHHETKQFIDDICQAANLPIFTEYEHPYIHSKRFVEFDEEVPPMPAERTLDYHDYILWVQYRLWKIMKFGIPIFVNYGECLSNDFGRSHIETILGVDGPGKRCIKSPIIWSPSGDLGHTDPGVGFGTWLLNSVALHYLLFDAMVGYGAFDFSAFPPRVATNESFVQLQTEGIWNSLGVAEA
jgi:hypothetical protein